jgi:hypothetical protein
MPGRGQRILLSCRLFHAGIDGEFIHQASDRKNLQHPLLRRGEQQVTPGLPSVPAAAR